jgi:hypothetical protein
METGKQQTLAQRPRSALSLLCRVEDPSGVRTADKMFEKRFKTPEIRVFRLVRN